MQHDPTTRACDKGNDMSRTCKECAAPLRRDQKTFCGRACMGVNYSRTNKLPPITDLNNVADRFWPKVEKTEGCWYWKAAKDPNGYGAFGINGRLMKAHRFAYELTYGISLGKLFACHHCDNPACVRPDHLFAGTRADNMQDCSRKGRIVSPFSHLSPENNPNARLTWEKVRHIRAQAASGMVSVRELTIQHGISDTHVRYILQGKTWRE